MALDCQSHHACIVLEVREDLIALPGQREILSGESAFVMRGQRQRHLVKTNINIRMVIELLRFPGEAIDECDAVQESLELESPMNDLRAL